MQLLQASRVVQWKRAGPITQRFVHQNQALLKQGLNEFGTFLIVPSLVHFSITIIIFAINWPYCAFYSLYTLR